MGNRFRAEGEIQFQYNSLKSTLQDSAPERSSSPDSVLPTTFSDDLYSDSAPEHVPNIPEHLPAVPEHIPAPPDPPARRPHQSRPPPPPPAPSSRAIKPTERGDASRFQKAGLSNSVPFPSGTDAEPNADPGGVPAEEEADEQELANIAHGEEPRTHKQAMASPDAAEWLAAEHYELDQLARLNTYQLTCLPRNRSRTGCHWVYKIKRDVDGNIILYRARLVAQGFTQRPGEDFFETFAPVVIVSFAHITTSD
jgi:Reverse transcriptase (RNA-dependent DNA polymerase)